MLTQRAKETLQYETTEGYDPLREKLYRFMKDEGMKISSKEEVMLTTGSQQALDLCTCTLSQHIAYEFMERGYLEGYIAKLKPAYKAKREVMYRALDKYFPKDAGWTKPNGGMLIWVTLLEAIDTSEMLECAVKREVAYVPGSPFHPSGGGKNTMRLNYSYPTPIQIEEGIKRLGEVIMESLN